MCRPCLIPLGVVFTTCIAGCMSGHTVAHHGWSEEFLVPRENLVRLEVYSGIGGQHLVRWRDPSSALVYHTLTAALEGGRKNRTLYISTYARIPQAGNAPEVFIKNIRANSNGVYEAFIDLPGFDPSTERVFYRDTQGTARVTYAGSVDEM